MSDNKENTIPIKPIDFCKKCGRCCEAIIIFSQTRENMKKIIENYNNNLVSKNPDISFIIKHWKIIDKEEALRRNSEIIVFGSELDKCAIFKCDQFNEETRKCMSYEIRPELCKEFPYYSKKTGLTILSSEFKAYTKDCGYLITQITE